MAGSTLVYLASPEEARGARSAWVGRPPRRTVKWARPTGLDTAPWAAPFSLPTRPLGLCVGALNSAVPGASASCGDPRPRTGPLPLSRAPKAGR